MDLLWEEDAGREDDKQPNAGCSRFNAVKSLQEKQRGVIIFLDHSCYPANVIHVFCQGSREPDVERGT